MLYKPIFSPTSGISISSKENRKVRSRQALLGIKLFSNFPEEKKAMKDAKNIFSQDDEIDHLNSQVQNDLIKRMSRNSKLVEQGTYIIWVAHNLERISDRANNIAERTIYVVTGDSAAIFSYELDE